MAEGRRTGGLPRVLGGRYELGPKLGSGGMAEVYLARDRRLGRQVAIKVLLPRYTEDERFIARFRREAEAAAALAHPGVVSVHDSGTDDGVPYIVMEYVPGQTLREVLSREGRLPPARAVEVALQVVEALGYAHSKGIVHRDVKPGNVMITPEGRVKVMDFGIARAISGETITQTATVLGTANYLSPEQAEGREVDHRSDLYSVGVLLYEMLTGRPPFTGENPVSVAYAHVREAPVPPRRINPDISPALEAVVMKALAKNPANRYQSAQEMKEDLEKAVRGEKVAAPGVLEAEAEAPTVLIRRPPQVERGWARALGIGFLVLSGSLLLAAAAYYVYRTVARAPLVEVPSLVGLDVEEAKRRLQAAGLRWDIRNQYSDKPVQTVIDQDPPAGTRVQRGRVVVLVVSIGRAQVEVPKVVGLPRAEAERILKEKGLVPRVLLEPSDEVPAGVVFRQDPAPGEVALAGSRVDLWVASGPATLEVPNVVGKAEEEARAELEGMGFSVIAQYRFSERPPGVVLDQNPAPGQRLPRGSTVVIYVSAGPLPTETPPSASPFPTFSPTPSPTGSP